MQHRIVHRTRPFFVALAILSSLASLACDASRLAAQQPAARDSTLCTARFDSSAGRTAPSIARNPTTSPPSSTARDSNKAGPVDVVIFAAATAREVTFASQPDLRVRLCGGLDSIHVLERRNLPSPVVAGTTYRDVYVAVQIFGRLNADCITRTLTGRAPRDTANAKSSQLDCASLELHGTASPTRPPADTGRPPRR
ncbi:MAG TPA: hypothetical protein VN706_08960 [Gemmatimonadaceae bacterium]|nr:hypothetical protein [Gemmatimonadaceae bacterium]